MLVSRYKQDRNIFDQSVLQTSLQISATVEMTLFATFQNLLIYRLEDLFRNLLSK